MLSLPWPVETLQSTPYSLTTPTQTRSTRWPCYCSNYLCSWQERRQSNGAYSTLLLLSYELPNYHKKNSSKNEGNLAYEYELLLFLQQQKVCSATAVKETANPSAWSHIFNFQRLSPPRRRARKLLSLCHTHECAKEPLSALPNNGLMENFGARAEVVNILQEKFRGRGASGCRFDRRFGSEKTCFFCGHCDTGGHAMIGTSLVSELPLEQHLTLLAGALVSFFPFVF